MKRKAKGSLRYDSTQSKKYKLSSADNKVHAPDKLNGSEKFLPAMGAPFSAKGRGARIPDMNLLPTVTTTLELDITQQVNAQFCAGGFLGLNSTAIYYVEEGWVSTDALVQFTGVNSGASTTAPVGQIIDATTNWQLTPMNYAANNTYQKLVPGWKSWSDSVSATRIVGAAIQVEFTGNDTNNGGSIFTYQITGPDAERSSNLVGDNAYAMDPANSGAGIRSTQTSIESNRSSYNNALKDGVNVSYLPCDSFDLEFGQTCPVANLLVANGFSGVAALKPQRLRAGSGDTANAVDQAISTSKNVGGIGWHISGGSVGASVRVSIVVHLEGLPINENVVVGPQEVGLTFTSLLNAAAGLCSATGSMGTGAMTKSETESLGNMYVQATSAIMKSVDDFQKGKITNLMSQASLAGKAEILMANTFFTDILKMSATGRLAIDLYNTGKKVYEGGKKVLKSVYV